MCVARNGCGELPRRRARYKLRWHCRRCCTTPQTGNHTAWMVSVVGTIQQSAARCPTAHSFAQQLQLRPAAEQKQIKANHAKWRSGAHQKFYASSHPRRRPSEARTLFPLFRLGSRLPTQETIQETMELASTPDPRASGREVKRAEQKQRDYWSQNSYVCHGLSPRFKTAL